MSELAGNLVVGAIVVVAAAYATWALALRRWWRTRKASRGGAVAGADCGCGGCDAPPARAGGADRERPTGH